MKMSTKAIGAGYATVLVGMWDLPESEIRNKKLKTLGSAVPIGLDANFACANAFKLPRSIRP
jgi:hypothetical protein